MKKRTKQNKETGNSRSEGPVKGRKAKRAKARDGRKRRLYVPPPESEVWPEQYRGENWKPAYALLFAGKCQLCAYSCPLPKSRQLKDRWHSETRLLLCTNHPASPGGLREVLPTETCRNFQTKHWTTPAPEHAKLRNDPPNSMRRSASDGDIRRIPLSRGLFATVDAADYERLSKYRWFASYRGRNVYAICRRKGRVVYMHRLIMRPPKGYVVDHIDGNGLNNRRCNLRVCTRAQNCANVGPRGGSSRFVGVYRCGKKWAAGISPRGKHHYLGLFDDEVEAAKARDRKAYELHGEHAFINLPEELDKWLREQRRHGRRRRKDL